VVFFSINTRPHTLTHQTHTHTHTHTHTPTPIRLALNGLFWVSLLCQPMCVCFFPMQPDPIPVCRYTNILCEHHSQHPCFDILGPKEEGVLIFLRGGLRLKVWRGEGQLMDVIFFPVYASIYVCTLIIQSVCVCVCVCVYWFRCAPCLLRVTFGDPPLKVDSINVGRITSVL